MKPVLLGLFNNISARFVPEDALGVKAEQPDLIQLVELARREWEAARSYFNSVTDPDLVDHAIYLIKAAEQKYVYLLRLAKNAQRAFPWQPMENGQE